MARLRRIDPGASGISRQRRGRGFAYLDADGNRMADPATLERIAELVIPPAWEDVWISPHPDSHLQAMGTDGAGRRQYLYHPHWRERRDRQKFERMVGFATALPRLRRTVARDLGQNGRHQREPSRERVLACAVRLLDRGFFRIGSESYARTNDTYGLATMQKSQVALQPDGTLLFDYVAKGSKRRRQRVVDDEAAAVIAALRRRRGGGPELLAYRRDGSWVDVRSREINDYVRGASGGPFTAKDFRTWHATVLAALGLSVAGPRPSHSARKRVIAQAVREVAHHVGNTPAVCRRSYIDPRVFDRYEQGMTIRLDLEPIAEFPLDRLSAIERAVLELLQGGRSARLLRGESERRAA